MPTKLITAYDGTRGRTSPLAEPENLKVICLAYVEGWTRQQMADEFDVSAWTISQWRKDPRVRAHCLKLIEDRVLRITSRTDSIIESRLQEAKNLDTETLLKIRKEYLGGNFRAQTEGNADDKTINETMEALDDDPTLAEELAALMEANSPAKL